MSTAAHLLASGPGWAVRDVVCTAGPGDRPFEEQHTTICIAAVTQGTFQYRTTQGAALLAPGAVLLGNHGACFECGHEHAIGDRCLAFHYSPDWWETILTDVPGAQRSRFAVPHLPPTPALLPLLAEAEAVRSACSFAAFEELALRLAGAVVALLTGSGVTRRPGLRDEKRITRALRRIEACPEERFAVTDLARDAAMSPYHFLRTFRQVVGMTPHQFILHARLRRAAVRLRASNDPVSTIAFDAGFNDLSSFNHRFRRVMNASPRAWRAGRRAA